MAEFDEAHWQSLFQAWIASLPGDAGHDLAHVQRVVANARAIHKKEDGDWPAIYAAAWLHDCVQIPKNDDRRNQASRLSAEKATQWLRLHHYPASLSAIAHAIEAHSFSANIAPKTIEAQIVQDADRLDALGAIGLARCLRVGVEMKTQLYNAQDPFCKQRPPDDRCYSIDHFYTKLLKLPHTFHTKNARKVAQIRADYLLGFLEQLEAELEGRA